VYTLDCSLIIVGTDSARAILTVLSSTLHFQGGILGNYGGEVNLGELATTDEIPRNGCTVVYEGNTSTHGTDPFYKSSDRDDTTRDFPLCHTSGRVFIYNSQFKVVDQTVRNDMLDINASSNEVDMRDCIFDGNTEGGAPTSYTHLMATNVYLEDVRIINFGVFEVGAATTKEWRGVAHTIGDMGLSAFQASIGNPVKLFGLKLRQQTYFGKRPTNSYAELTNLDYSGSYNFQAFAGQYYGVWKLLYTVDATSVSSGSLIPDVRNAMTDTNNNITFDQLSDSNGEIPQQRAIAYVAEEGVNGFNVNNNPFSFKAWQYGKKAVEIPTTLNGAYVASASMVANPYITYTESAASSVAITLEKTLALQLLEDGDFTGPSTYSGLDGQDEDKWYSTNTSECYLFGGELLMRRNGSVPWNGGAIVYQNFTTIIGVEYTIDVKVNDMGGAGQFRFGFASYNEYVITSAGSYQYKFTATSTSYKIMINTDPGTYTDFTKIEYFKIFDPLSLGTRFSDADDNLYTYKIDCENNSIVAIYHKLAHLWAQTSINTDTHYPLTTVVSEGIRTSDGTVFHGGKGIFFDNFTGTLKDMIADDDTVYTFPTSITLAAPNLIDGTRVQIYNITKSAEVNNSVVSGGSGYSFTTQTGVSFNIEVGDTIRMRACYQDLAVAKMPIIVNGLVSASGATFLDTQTTDTEYGSFGVDGKTVDLTASPSTGEVVSDYTNIQIDVNDPDNLFDSRRGVAWWRYITQTEDGIRYFDPNALKYNPDIRNIVIQTGLTIENVKTDLLVVSGGVWEHADGTHIIASTSNSIHWVPDTRVFQGPETGVSGLTSTESSKLAALDTSNLDAAISTVPGLIWDEQVDGHTAAGTIGEKVGKKLLTLSQWVGLSK